MLQGLLTSASLPSSPRSAVSSPPSASHPPRLSVLAELAAEGAAAHPSPRLSLRAPVRVVERSGAFLLAGRPGWPVASNLAACRRKGPAAAGVLAVIHKCYQLVGSLESHASSRMNAYMLLHEGLCHFL